MKKLFALVLALCMVFTLCACGAKEEAPAAAPAADEEVAPGPVKIVVGASSTPHAEILEQVKAPLAEAGYELEIVVYDDYVLPNTALFDGDLDANYFRHTPYLTSFNASNGMNLVSAALIHYEPFGLYGNGITSLENIPAGTTIIVPADDSNETRALFLLQQEGLITLAEGSTVEKGVTILDIADNKGYNVIHVQADTVPAVLANEANSLAVVNGNYALAAGLKIENALATEDASGDAAQLYANIIAVREGEENSAKTQALVNALLTESVKTYIANTYSGAVMAVFE